MRSPSQGFGFETGGVFGGVALLEVIERLRQDPIKLDLLGVFGLNAGRMGENKKGQADAADFLGKRSDRTGEDVIDQLVKLGRIAPARLGGFDSFFGKPQAPLFQVSNVILPEGRARPFGGLGLAVLTKWRRRAGFCAQAAGVAYRIIRPGVVGFAVQNIFHGVTG